MALTPHAQLQQWLVLVLGDAGGSAPRAEALALIEQRFASAFSAADLEPVPSRPWEAKWRNRVSWERNRMVKSGLLGAYVEAGTPWTLTGAGRALYRELAQEIGPNDPLAHFKPKSSDEYRAHLALRTLIKQRSHEQLVSDFGRWAIDQGWTPRTEVHPRDLVLEGFGHHWLVEAKVVYVGNATRAVREATSQLLMYRFLWYHTDPPQMLAVFTEDVGSEYVRFLESVGIASAWRDANTWTLSPSATSLRHTSAN